MNFLAFSGFISFITSIYLAFLILLRNYRNPHNRSFFYLSSSIAIYGLGYFLWQIVGTYASALFCFKILMIGVIFVPTVYLHFIFVLLGVFQKKKRELFLFYLISIVFLYCNFTMLLYDGLEPRFGYGLWPIINLLTSIYITYWIAQVSYGFILLVQGWRHTTGMKREQIKFFIIAMLVAFASGSTNWLVWYKVHVFPLTILISLYVAITAYAIIRLRFLNIAALTVRGIFLVCYSFVLVLPVMVGHVTNDWFLATMLSLGVGSVGHLVFKWFIGKAENRMMSEQKKYQNMLKNIAYQVLRYHDAVRLARHIVEASVNIVRLKGASIFLHDHKNQHFKLAAIENKAELPVREIIDASSPLIKELSTRSDYLNIEAVMLENDLPNGNPYKNSMYHFAKDSGASLLFALRTKDRLLGLLALGSKSNGSVFTRDDIDVFSLLSYQSALALENCQYLDEIKALYDKAVTDKLTGCYNRMFYEEYLERAVKSARQKELSLYLAILDLNYFKHLNDTYGHDFGDHVLAEFGMLLKKCFQGEGIVVRYGGDEFVVVFEDMSRLQCETCIKNLIGELVSKAVSVKSGNTEVSAKISASIGIARLKDHQTREELFHDADRALFESKKLKHNYIFSD